MCYMAATLKPNLNSLPEPQRRLWDELGSTPGEFVLYGGTAVALHLGHRVSVDFDLFTAHEFDPGKLYKSIPYLAGSTIIQQEPNTLTCLVDRDGEVKVSFFALPHMGRIEQPLASEGNGLQVASLLDLAGTKVELVQRRAQAKDYIDIDAILTSGIDLSTALGAARAIHGDGFQPTPSLKALTYFGDGNLQEVPAEARERLVRAAAAVDPLRLPSLKRAAMPNKGTDK